MKKHITLLMSLLLIISLLTGCGSSSDSKVTNTMASAGSAMDKNNSISFDTEYKTEESMEAETDGGIGGEGSAVEAGEQANTDIELDLEKLVYRANVTIETLKYKEALNDIKETINSMGGFIQYESESDDDYNWYYSDHYKTRGTLSAYISCRIPTKNFSAFMEGLNDYGKVVDKNSSVENISQQYNDTTTKIASLKIQEERLLNMLEKAVTIEEMLNIEDRLEEVRYEINRLETDVRHMDMDVAYSYVNVTLAEVLEYTPDETPAKKNTFFDRLKNTFADSAEGFLDFCEGVLFAVIILAPYIIIISIVLMIICKVKKSSLKELFKRKSKEKKPIEGISTKNIKEN